MRRLEVDFVFVLETCIPVDGIMLGVRLSESFLPRDRVEALRRRNLARAATV